MAKTTTVTLVYIHGFRGDVTTFQAFPTDLHEQLAPLLPPEIKLKSIFYPTYKSIRPISVATHNFLDWLEAQPPGPVILFAHSMGGLLAADAVTSRKPVAQRIIGLVNFDVPFLGMHPHVVVSGLASLFPKDASNAPKTEHELNEAGPVHTAGPPREDERDAHSTAPRSPSPAAPPRSPSPSARTLEDRAVSLLAKYADDPRVRWMRKHADDPLGAMRRWVVEHFEFGACVFDPSGLLVRYRALEAWRGLWINYWTQTPPSEASAAAVTQERKEEGDAHASGLPAGTADLPVSTADLPTSTTDLASTVDLLASPADLLPASTTDLSASTTGVASTTDLPTSTAETLPDAERDDSAEAKAARKAADKERKIAEKERKAAEKERKAAEKELEKERKRIKKAQEKAVKDARKQQEREEKREAPRPARHFIVLPVGFGRPQAGVGSGEKWENVQIRGAPDEVAAHCGLFIRKLNVDYDKFVERVATLVLDWCQGLSP